jgi:hypothetical protein
MANPTSIMIYGNSGSTKTTQLYHMAKYILKRYPEKRIRLIHSDGGGCAPFVDSGMVERNEVEIFDFSNRQFAFADIRRLSSGYWPRYVKDGQAHQFPVEGGVMYFRPEPVCLTTAEEWEKISAVFIEGMTSTASMLLAHCSNRDETVGFKANYKYEEDGESFTGVSEGHYGIVQKEIYERHMKGFRTLPVQWLVWTALVGKGQDKKQSMPVRGPQMIGDAKTNEIPSWFNHVFHMDRVTYQNVPNKLSTALQRPANNEAVQKIVAWFEEHKATDELGQTVPYLCKSTVMPELLQKRSEFFPYGFIPLEYDYGIEMYFKVLEKLRKEQNGN